MCKWSPLLHSTTRAVAYSTGTRLFGVVLRLFPPPIDYIFRGTQGTGESLMVWERVLLRFTTSRSVQRFAKLEIRAFSSEVVSSAACIGSIKIYAISRLVLGVLATQIGTI